jgi:hypothetical protein
MVAGFVEAARFLGGQPFAPSSAKLSHNMCLPLLDIVPNAFTLSESQKIHFCVLSYRQAGMRPRKSAETIFDRIALGRHS